MFAKKRGDIALKIDWKLLNDGEEIINNENQEARFEDNNIIYKDEYGEHIVDLDNKVYKRIAEDNTMSIDFKESILTIEFSNNKFDYVIDTKFKNEGNIIELEYSLGDEVKTIIIKRKEEL